MSVYTDDLFALRDEVYAEFQQRLTPNIPPEKMIGVRVPLVRQFAKAHIADPRTADFLADLPHTYYDENMLHGCLIEQIKDYDTCVSAIDAFLPYIDNWAVCDIMSPKIFKKHKAELWQKIPLWIASPAEYTCRFGLEMLMTWFLNEDFTPEVLDLACSATSDFYYVKMMVAWFVATALTKQWEATLPILQEKRLATWTHNKAIQKACESYRITPEQKALLRALKISAK